MSLTQESIHFMNQQGFVIVSTMDDKGRIHCSAKGIVGIEKSGKVYIIDLYLHHTYKNLKKNPVVSITAVNEHQFKGYTLQGKAKIVSREEIEDAIFKKWEKKVISRISKRIVKGVQSETKSKAPFEAHLPHQPQYLIEVNVENVIDLSPPGMARKKL